MCKHCDNFDPKAAAETMLRNSAPAAQEPAWIEKLGGIVVPAAFIAFLAWIVLAILWATGRPVNFNTDTVWVLKAYAIALSLGFWTYIIAAAWHRGLRCDIRVFKNAIRWLILDWKVRSVTLAMVSVSDDLEMAQEDYCGAASRSSRAPELSREIVRLKEYKDMLQVELDRLMAELREARSDRFN